MTQQTDITTGRILRVLDHIYANAGDDLSLDALADVAALSRFHFHRMFHAVTGETVAGAVRRIRMNRAAHLLVRDEMPVEAISRAVGYDNTDSFNRAFLRAFGLRPAGFRARGKLVLSRGPDPDNRRVNLSYPTEIRDLPANRLATLDHVGPYHDVAKAFQSLAALMTTRGLWPHADAMVGIYFDDPYTVPEEKLRSKACVIVDDKMEIAEPMAEFGTEAGEHAVLTYTGPYSGLPQVYDWLYSEWLPKSGRQPADRPCWEKNINDPTDTPPDQLVTEICLPLAPA